MLAPTIAPRDALTVARIVRVNHAGEYGAIRIYSAQIALAARLYPDVVPALADMLAHEREHCTAFRAAMPARRSQEELSHLHHAETRITASGPGAHLLRAVIASATDTVIWLSTWGDSTRMARDLRVSLRGA